MIRVRSRILRPAPLSDLQTDFSLHTTPGADTLPRSSGRAWEHRSMKQKKAYSSSETVLLGPY
jgi:hypothetical protein